MHNLSVALKLAQKKKTAAEARENLFKLGIIGETGHLADRYQAKTGSSRSNRRRNMPKAGRKTRASRIPPKSSLS
jgi:hypothetical protein